MLGWKRMNVRRLIERALAFEAGVGLLHGCPCPPQSVDGMPGVPPTRIVGGATEAFRAYHVNVCVHACAGVGMACDVAQAAAIDSFGPKQVTCSTVNDAGPSRPEYLPVVARWPGGEARDDDPVRAPTCRDVCGTAFCMVDGASVARHTLLCYQAPPVAMEKCSAGGRAPAGLRPLASDGLAAVDPVAAYWRSMAHLERASVSAFLELADELGRHGATPELVRRARAAARDEARHARLCEARLTARAVPLPVLERDVEPPIDRWELAVQNARQGCVREAFGALVARVQAAHAADDETRRAFTRIAHDETAHGQLAWDVHAWLRATLPAEECEALDRVLEDELAALSAEALRGARERGLPEVGYPDGEGMRSLTGVFVASVRAYLTSADVIVP